MNVSPELEVEDMEYLRHGGEPLLARVYRPSGDGPFPAVIELHGGAWSQFDRTRGTALHEALARSGLVVVALDFRQGAIGAYPRSVADIHYGIRWVKARAGALNIDPRRVALSGNSSGAHLAMLVAMRPNDPRYASIPLEGAEPHDAGVRCVAMFWPVINPSGRYRYARRLRDSDSPPEWPARNMQQSLSYWATEENMEEGNPMLALMRGEDLRTPPAIWIRSAHDEIHDYHDAEMDYPGNQSELFVRKYREAGGEIELHSYDAPYLFTTEHPALPQSIEAMRRVIDFIHANVGSPSGASPGPQPM